MGKLFIKKEEEERRNVILLLLDPPLSLSSCLLSGVCACISMAGIGPSEKKEEGVTYLEIVFVYSSSK
jgi:hypothetical protein